jgi:hypothetical protein
VVTGFLDPFGSGKSTTMRMILGLDAPDRGEALIAGVQYPDLSWPLKAPRTVRFIPWAREGQDLSELPDSCSGLHGSGSSLRSSLVKDLAHWEAAAWFLAAIRVLHGRDPPCADCARPIMC